MKSDVLIIRIAFVGFLAVLAYLINPLERTQRFGLGQLGDPAIRHFLSAFLGIIVGLFIIAFEMRVRRASLKTLIGELVY